ncbi:FLOWERING TIME CONTROL PROTEIN FPA [Salix koriyanagi]|uniref:FLOWERING TIME CONTROL PROTEIN FPA n=1 Tax=Salix koriyanagi TaxID=2511006 RepID=A0A9Q0PN77_9ROSI|nr:FLOWERING TIME CONTROL PROTEIN FPA [Salix koriyanagi]
MAPLPVKSNKAGTLKSETDQQSSSEVKESNNLWVGNISREVADSDLMELFAQFGALDSVTTYSARSYAFVYFKHVEDAKQAKDALQGTSLRGNQIKIEFARPVCCSFHLITIIIFHNFNLILGFTDFGLNLMIDLLCNIIYSRLCVDDDNRISHKNPFFLP